MSAFTEANRKAFDDLASTYNTKPWQIKISQQVSSALQQRKSWLGAQWTTPEEHDQTTTTTSTPTRRQVRLLDYACGTGSVTQALGSYVTSIRGIDISENMVTHYNEAARSSGLTTEQAHAVVGDLIGPEPPAAELSGPEFYNFDIAAIGLGFHHFEDPPLAVKRLGERLKAETGVLVIVDFLPFEHNPDAAAQHNHSHSHSHHEGQQSRSAQHTIKHNGFTATGIQHLFASAGLTEDFAFDVLPEPAVFDFPEGRKERTLFIAKARKGPTFWNKVKTWVNGSLDAMGGQVQVRGPDEGGLPAFAPRRDDAGDGAGVFQPRRGVDDGEEGEGGGEGGRAFQPRRDAA